MLVDDFVLPLADDDLLVEIVEPVEHVVTVQLAVVSEGFQQFDDLLNVQIIAFLFHKCFPPVDACLGALV